MSTTGFSPGLLALGPLVVCALCGLGGIEPSTQLSAIRVGWLALGLGFEPACIIRTGEARVSNLSAERLISTNLCPNPCFVGPADPLVICGVDRFDSLGAHSRFYDPKPDLVGT
jgi:hypothetical protein